MKLALDTEVRPPWLIEGFFAAFALSPEADCRGSHHSARPTLLLNQHDVKFTVVKGHSGHPENERCDELAVAAAESMR